MSPKPKYDPEAETDPDTRQLLGLPPLAPVSPPGPPARSPGKANLARGASADPELLAEKVRLTAAQGTKLELQNAAARAELVRAAAVEREWTNILHDVRRAMLAVPARLTGVERSIVERVDREIRDALEGLADEA